MKFSRKKMLIISMSVIVAIGFVVLAAAKTVPRTVTPKIDRIVFITLDTLRADHLGSYGYIRSTSPFLDEMAERGIFFTKCVASMSTTCPSHASLFTALYPMLNGVRKNGHVLDESFVTLAEILSEKGFLTAGVVSTDRHFKAGGMAQGFSYFDEPVDLTNLRYRPAGETVDRAVQWLGGIRKKKKFFLWIHVFDPHEPLRPDRRHFKLMSESMPRKDVTGFLLNRHHTGTEIFDGDSSRMFRRITKYDAEISYLDTELERFYRQYVKKGFGKNTLWVITADHGEGLGNHNLWGHGMHIYNEQIRVPLIFYFSGMRSRDGKRKNIVENVDVLPTVLELVKASPVTEEAVNGESLVPLMFRSMKRSYSKRHAFSQRRDYGSREKYATAGHRGGEEYSIQTGRYKYIHRTMHEDEFYDLRADPYETKNLISMKSRDKDTLHDALMKKISELKKVEYRDVVEVDDEIKQKLKELGYVQ